MTDPVESEAVEALAARLAAEVARQCAQPLAPGLHVVATPIGNLGDITVRALTVLARADLICCEDTRHSRVLLAHYGIDRPLRSYHEHNAEAERPRILRLLAEGRRVALISDAGTPLVSDPGYKLVEEAIAAGHAVTALPGPSALLAGLVVSGLPTDAVHFAGFLPAKEGARRARLEALVQLPATLVLLEAPGRLARTLASLAGMVGDRQVVVARELTKRFEEVRRGPAAELAAWAEGGDVRGEIVLLLAPPDARDHEASEAEIGDALGALMQALSLKDAVRAVAERLKAPRSRVYEIALRLKGGQP